MRAILRIVRDVLSEQFIVGSRKCFQRFLWKGSKKRIAGVRMDNPVMGRPVKIEAYIRHLDKFSQPERGPALKKEGMKRKFEYGFVQPMMQPYVLMKGLAEGKI